MVLVDRVCVIGVQPLYRQLQARMSILDKKVKVPRNRPKSPEGVQV
jgi:hypothetical protein